MNTVRKRRTCFYLLPFCLPFWAAFMTLSFKTVLNILTWVPSHWKSKESDDCVHWIVHVWTMLNLRSIQPQIRGTSLWWCVGWSLEEICRASFGATQTLAACRHLSHTGHRPRLVEPFSKVENLDIRKENSWKLSASHLNLVVFPDLNYAGSVHDLAWYGQKEMSHRGAV